MNKQEVMKMQTHTLKVNIECHCDGCKKKIKKMLQKIEGVYTTTINAEQGRVTVTGNVDPAKLIKQLEKSGKHAELWGGQKGSNNFQNVVNNQFKNMKIEMEQEKVTRILAKWVRWVRWVIWARWVIWGGGGGKAEKGGGGDVFEIPVVMKGKGDGKDGKKGDGKNGKSKGENKKKDGKSGIGIGFLGFGKKSKKGEDSTNKAAANHGSAGGNGNSNGNGTKKGGGKTDGVDVMNKMKQGFHENDGTGKGHKNPGQMGPMGHMGLMGGMGSVPTVQGLPAAAAMNGGGYYPGLGQGNPYNQQQQYMAMMMNQQRQNGNDMFQPMMYARPHPSINYMQPPIPPPTVSDQYTHFFNDENTDSCSIM
ncbi:PREDICTED: uncharacterized protein LOC105134304 [Populus euphratica]|uniref:Uncharacterized protein LOC105134304 n=1 Tax=Populus euphratica TaxID=75702 RepID=A0AAJ6UXA8_POPEU|nr:PREDICTED: uncharacterized protein LOC105134304 [Populus euphratica]